MKKFRLPLMLTLGIFMIALIINPVRYMASASMGLKLFAISVLPALFPFFFFTRVLTSLGAAHTLGASIKRPLEKLYNAPPITGYIMAMSMLSGYPTGAKLVAECHNLELIECKDAQFASVLCSTSGPLFILGTIGGVALADKLAGVVILLSHYIASLVNGLLYRNKTTGHNPKTVALQLSAKSDNLLRDCIYESIIAILLVGGYIVIFSMVIDILLDIGLQATLVYLLGLFGIGKEISIACFASLMEITRGCFMVSSLPLSRLGKAVFLSGVISFGGICIGLQSLAFLSKCNISAARYFLAKSSQAVIAIIVATLLGLLILK